VFILSGQSNAVGYNNVKEYKQGKSELPEAFRKSAGHLVLGCKKEFLE